MVCDCGCGQTLTGKQRRWSSQQCRWRGYSRGWRNPEFFITDAVIAEVKRLFPSCAQDIDDDLAERIIPERFEHLIRKIERLDRRADESAV